VSHVTITHTGIDGRSYPDIESMLRAEVEEVVADKFDTVERAIRRQTCSVHHRSPSVQRTRTGNEVSFRIEACCDRLRDDAQAAADRAFAS
jgi:hypothetical protein